MSEAARSRRFDPNFEPPMQPAAAPPPAVDPLAELARLVGQEDPFRNMFRASAAAPGARAVRPGVAPQVPAPQPAGNAVQDAHRLGLRPTAHDDGAWAEADASAATEPEGFEPFAHGHGHGQPDESFLPLPSPADANQPAESHAAADQFFPDPAEGLAPALSDEKAVLDRAPRRPLAVLFAVLALTGGGLAATFLARTGTGVARTNAGGPPTIMASSEPTKIQQVDTTSTSKTADAESALLSKNGEAGSGPVKVNKSQEQPLDLAQLPKPAAVADGAAGTQPASPSSPFPQPKKVKTFLVHPDGSAITAPGAAMAPSALPQMASIAAIATAPAQPGSEAAQATLKPATPKAAQAATTPKSAPTSIADMAADATNTVPKPRQAAAPGPKVIKSKPVQVADAAASDVGSTPQGTGGFALQLAASPSEQDAREAFTRMQKKFADLSSFKPTVRKADSGDKSVYRLRVGNLSQDQAKTLCAKLQAGGGSCFVVRN